MVWVGTDSAKQCFISFESEIAGSHPMMTLSADNCTFLTGMNISRNVRMVIVGEPLGESMYQLGVRGLYDNTGGI